MTNPLLTQKNLPSFSDIQPEYIEPAIRQIMNENRSRLISLLSEGKKYTWENLMQPLEDMSDKLNKAWSPVAHLHAVCETEKLRAVYNTCLPLLTEYSTEIMQNTKLYQAIRFIAESVEYQTLDFAQQKVIQNELRDFHLAGVDLSDEKKAKFAELQKQLTQLTTKFSENILDATQAWTLNIANEVTLAGLPESVKIIAKENAAQRQQKGWTLTLDYPCYAGVIKYAEDRELRRAMYEAYSTRASDKGPFAGRWDNTQVMEDILKMRQALAELLGFKNYAEVSLATKMAKHPERVLDFLLDLVSRAKAAGEKEIAELTQFAKEKDNLEKLAAWDVAYYSEKLREKCYDISQEDLRPYFPVPKVLKGMFTVVSKLFGLHIEERKGVDVWHPQVQFFEIRDATGKLRGCFYTDLYARAHKRDGAWMDEARVRRQLSNGEVQVPVAFLTCNFTRPIENKPSYLTHDEVTTLFHEFGHCLHHLLTQINYASVSGINGVPWDAVEFPSQFLENWCWDKEVLNLITEHEVTHQTLPDALYNKMVAAKNFQSALYLLRQLEFALFDFQLHLTFDSTKGPQVQTTLDNIRKQISVVPVPDFNRFQHSFSHIFAGGYAAGYYSYAWADVLACDAFSRFEEEGVLSPNVGQAFLQNILEQGGAKDPMDLFVAFRGREPKIDALLKQNGLVYN